MIVTQRPRIVLLATLVVVLGAAVVGVGAFGKLLTGGFDDPSSDSSQVADLVDYRFGGDPNLILLVTATDGTVDEPAVVEAGRALTAELAGEPGVTNVASYWVGGGEPLRSDDARHALVVASVRDDDLAESLVERFQEPGEPDSPVLVRPGGPATANEDIPGQVTKDLATAESMAIPITMVLLVIAFGGLVAALLPLTVGLMGILGGFAALSVLGGLTDVSIFAVNLATALGLGLGIDYALLMVSRFREELATGADRPTAVATTVRTAGRTIVFSGATVVAALAVMLVFPPFFLKSMAYAGIAVTLVAVLAAMIALPALLMVLGNRINALRIGGIIGFVRRRRAARAAACGGAVAGGAAAGGAAAGGAAAESARPRELAESPFWRATANRVMRRPLLFGVPVVGLLLVLGVPFLHVNFGTPDDRVLRDDATSRQVGDVIREDFSSNLAGSLDTIVLGPATSAGLTGYAERVSDLPDVDRVETTLGTFVDGTLALEPGPANARFAADGATYLLVVPSVDPASDAAQDLTRAVRAEAAPDGAEQVLVGGSPAVLVDGKATIAEHLPLAVGLICLATFVLLFLFTGSVVLPLKAIVLNGLVLSAVLGVSVWIFQDGHLSGWLDFVPGPLDTSMPVLLFCIAFGLSMDYELFLLSRIKEEYQAGATNTEAVATGLARSGRIVTTLAALLAVTFIAFATGSVRFMQMFGLGTALAIVIDATIVRALLVPAFMRVLGDANWWAPKPLRVLHTKIGLSDSDAAPAPVPAPVLAPPAAASPEPEAASPEPEAASPEPEAASTPGEAPAQRSSGTSGSPDAAAPVNR